MVIVQFFVVWLVYPETKGTSLEAVQKNLGIIVRRPRSSA
jgi:hypothetical protein